MNDNAFEEAVAAFTGAENKLPKIFKNKFVLRDLLRIHTQKGIALHRQGLNYWKNKGVSTKTLSFYGKAKVCLSKAVQIDPLSYLATYWIARTENALEVISEALFPGAKKKYNTQALYEKATHLRPNGVSVHYDLIRYLYRKGETQQVLKLAQYIAQIYPESYYYFRKEPFFNDPLLNHLEKGILLSLKAGSSPKSSLQALSDIYLKKQDIDKAISYYQKSLKDKFKNTPHDYIRMGMLYLKRSNHASSIEWFTKGVEKTNDFDSTINHIFNIHKKEGALAPYIRLLVHLEENRPHISSLDIPIAKTWIEMGNLPLAKARLLRLTTKKPNPEAYYLLAKISEKEMDWEQVELMAHKATVFDKKDSKYFYLFSRALYKQNKFNQAEEMAEKAIKHSQKNNAGLFNHRAWTRWEQGKYAKAASDWTRAYNIQPDKSEFLYWIARAYEQVAMFSEARKFLKKAIAMDTETPKYKDLKKRLETHKQ
ncbi:MAG: tetratricopeptide repeat protein [Desulfobacteraceae bacterium]|nr:tetratricopeptide repeat protein [Desulfobacteraceae bacterium]